MMHRFYINKEWIVSGNARRVYRACAWISLGFVALLFWLMNVEEIPAVLATTVTLAMAIGVFATAVMFVAMEYFFFGFDTITSWKKTLWFFALCLPPIGTALYCLLVYSKVVGAQSTDSLPSQTTQVDG